MKINTKDKYVLDAIIMPFISWVAIIFLLFFFHYIDPNTAGFVFSFIVLILIFIATVARYNSLNHYLHKSIEAETNIETTMHIRLSLTKKLVEIVEKFAENEKDIHKTISENRKEFISNPERLIMYVSAKDERFPDLKADRTYINIMNEITDIENEVKSKYSIYNSFVQQYNEKHQQFFSLFLNIFFPLPMLQPLNSSMWHPNENNNE